MYYCLFEQSGTFKNEFKKLGYEAIDYDIQNEFNETDVVIDLFKEIEKAYNKEESIFDNITEKDTILAFFPCVRFEDQVQMHFRGTAFQQKKWTDEQKLENDLKLHKELDLMYETITKLALFMVIRNSLVMTRGIIKGKTMKEINEMSYETMCSVLTMIDYDQAKKFYEEGKDGRK